MVQHGWTARWVKNWLDSWAQRVVVNGLILVLCLEASKGGVLQGSLLEPVVFSIFINNMAKVTESTIVRFAHVTKLEGTVITLPSRGTWTDGRNEQTGRGAALWKRSWVSQLAVS